MSFLLVHLLSYIHLVTASERWTNFFIRGRPSGRMISFCSSRGLKYKSALSINHVPLTFTSIDFLSATTSIPKTAHAQIVFITVIYPFITITLGYPCNHHSMVSSDLLGLNIGRIPDFKETDTHKTVQATMHLQRKKHRSFRPRIPRISCE